MLKLFHQNYSTVCTFPCTVLILVLSVIPLPRPDEIRDVFIQFGGLMVNWPHKAQSKAYFPPNGIYQHTVTHMWLPLASFPVPSYRKCRGRVWTHRLYEHVVFTLYTYWANTDC